MLPGTLVLALSLAGGVTTRPGEARGEAAGFYYLRVGDEAKPASGRPRTLTGDACPHLPKNYVPPERSASRPD